MPLYNYACKKCNHEFTEIYHIEDRKIPLGKACPNCKKRKCVDQVIYAPAIGDAVRLGVTRPSVEFQEVLQKIHSKVPGSKLNQKFSTHVPAKKKL